MASWEIRIGSLVSPPPFPASFSKEDECLSWLSEDIIVSPLPEASDVLLGMGSVDKWLSEAVVPFADDFTVLRDHHQHHRKHHRFWLMTVNKAYSHAIMDALRVCDQRIICLQARGDMTTLWKEEAPIKKKKDGPAKKSDTYNPLVFWPSPHYKRTEERRSFFFGSADITPTLSISKVTIVLLGPMCDVSPAAVERILRCVGVWTLLIGSVAVGDSHRAVAFSGKAAGWLLVARSPTILVDARMLS